MPGPLLTNFVGRPHDVVLATLSGGAWTDTTLSRAHGDGDLGLAVDGLGRLHIAFAGCATGVGCGIRYGIRDGAGWTIQTAVAPGSFTHVALSVDTTGVPVAIATSISDGVRVFD